MIRTFLSRLWFYRPWHRVGVIYAEDGVLVSAFMATVLTGTLACLLLAGLQNAARLCGTAKGRPRFYFAEPRGSSARPRRSWMEHAGRWFDGLSTISPILILIADVSVNRRVDMVSFLAFNLAIQSLRLALIGENK